jgi:protoporphyrinogen oxidase
MSDNKRKRIAIIGAGAAGLAAAWQLLKATPAPEITIYEAGERIGGLAAGFSDAGWAWELEKFYHHWFESDHDILALIAELGLADKVLFPQPKTAMWAKGKAYKFDTPAAMLAFPHLPLVPKLRFGLTGLYLRLSKNWQAMEQFTAQDWLTQRMGKQAYEDLWRPMLIGKFGDVYDKVTMAWFWARIHTRSVKLGTFEGGFQHFLDTFANTLRDKGVQIQLKTAVDKIERVGDKLSLTLAGDYAAYDAVISTASPALTLKLAPALASLDPAYAQQLQGLKHMGAVVLVAALRQQLLTDGTYWLNLPATSTNKQQSEFPFVALCEHTNWMQREHYNNDHLVYCGEYIAPNHAYLTMPEADLANLFLGALNKINPAFNTGWVRKWWLFRTPYAQPIPFVNHSQRIPALKTPMHGLYMANMSQVYPYDRGTNYAVRLGQQVAKQVLADAT